jgi:5-methylcytosine-specific restriction protein A
MAIYRKHLDISSEQWLLILQNKSTTDEIVWRLLDSMYKYGKGVNAKYLSVLMNLPNYQILNHQASTFGWHIAKTYKSMNYPKDKKGKIEFWHIPFWGEKRAGYSYWELRPELKAAIEKMHQLALCSLKLPTEIKELHDEETDLSMHDEGSKMKVIVNRYERSPKARQLCLNHYGYICCICDFNFEKVYGLLGRRYAEVHHLIPLHTISKRYKVDPVKDLRPVCANCHAMIHKGNLSIEELKVIVNRIREKHN